MRRYTALAASILFTVALLAALALRYEQQGIRDGVKRYADRWTGVEWVEVDHAYGRDRIPLRFYQTQDAARLSEAIVAELEHIAEEEDLLLTGWWGLLTLCLAGVIYGCKRVRRSRGGGI